ncbi:lipolytic enzyme [Ascobolus immersus RN42]|uniref:Lipolytic enzyme n=1 Tax=Ascobolus immersus RN42 TaxID=1160509 RepID=A0A3N4I703_ASCIM|nr:lipolytic enzyme [Ascobolus immersus RN42]
MFGRGILPLIVALFAILGLTISVQAAPAPHSKRWFWKRPANHWVDTWASMPQIVEPHNLPNAPFNVSGMVFGDSTIRQTVHLALGGNKLRVRISNSYGNTPLPITAASIALPKDGAAGVSTILPSSSRSLTFSGSSSITIPPGAVALSDPITYSVKPDSNLAITLYTPGQPSNIVTGHPGSRTTSWWTNGNQVSSSTLSGPTLASAAHWYFISSVEVYTTTTNAAFVIVGDSITDGRGSTNDKNDRWPNLLFSRLQSSPSTRSISVINQAAGGNRVLADGLGPSAFSRIDRDVLAHSGVRYAMIYEGVNDIGSAPDTHEAQTAIVAQLIQAYSQIVATLHAQNIPVFGATITPFLGETVGTYSGIHREAAREKINRWIRESGVFDEVVDFDKAVRDPDTGYLKPEYDTGDHLHLNVKGFHALAAAFPQKVFRKWEDGYQGL